MMIVPNFVAPSQIHVVGLFSGRAIPKGEVVYYHMKAVDITMTDSDLATIGEEFRKFMGTYAYMDNSRGCRVISLDNSCFMNHADDPNTEWDDFKGWAIRDIAEGEEFTCDYRTFYGELPEWLSKAADNEEQGKLEEHMKVYTLVGCVNVGA